MKARIGRELSRTRHWIGQHQLRSAAAGLPLPPPDKVRLVTGTDDLDWYVEGGRLARRSIEFALARNSVDMTEFDAILDFGCGSGRVIRYWKDLPAAVHGTDYNSELIEWCRSAIGFAQFDVNEPNPPVAYPSEVFDLVYALSVFTHMDESSQLRWRDELRRILRPGGYLILTTHGPCKAYLQQLDAADRRQLLDGRMVVVHEEKLGTNACASYHPEEYVSGTLSQGFEVVDFLRGGSFGTPYQDLWLMRRS